MVIEGAFELIGKPVILKVKQESEPLRGRLLNVDPWTFTILLLIKKEDAKTEEQLEDEERQDQTMSTEGRTPPQRSDKIAIIMGHALLDIKFDEYSSEPPLIQEDISKVLDLISRTQSSTRNKLFNTMEEATLSLINFLKTQQVSATVYNISIPSTSMGDIKISYDHGRSRIELLEGSVSIEPPYVVSGVISKDVFKQNMVKDLGNSKKKEPLLSPKEAALVYDFTRRHENVQSPPKHMQFPGELKHGEGVSRRGVRDRKLSQEDKEENKRIDMIAKQREEAR
ncbi:hypothetical protein HDV05_001522 [Chytridiales sp. JEL 0842]|nr:hypothetical protein HDV05_001522 [Chytridiales sp. JEL 0842]